MSLEIYPTLIRVHPKQTYSSLDEVLAEGKGSFNLVPGVYTVSLPQTIQLAPNEHLYINGNGSTIIFKNTISVIGGAPISLGSVSYPLPVLPSNVSGVAVVLSDIDWYEYRGGIEKKRALDYILNGVPLFPLLDGWDATNTVAAYYWPQGGTLIIENAHIISDCPAAIFVGQGANVSLHNVTVETTYGNANTIYIHGSPDVQIDGMTCIMDGYNSGYYPILTQYIINLSIRKVRTNSTTSSKRWWGANWIINAHVTDITNGRYDTHRTVYNRFVLERSTIYDYNASGISGIGDIIIRDTTFIAKASTILAAVRDDAPFIGNVILENITVDASKMPQYGYVALVGSWRDSAYPPPMPAKIGNVLCHNIAIKAPSGLTTYTRLSRYAIGNINSISVNGLRTNNVLQGGFPNAYDARTAKIVLSNVTPSSGVLTAPQIVVQHSENISIKDSNSLIIHSSNITVDGGSARSIYSTVSTINGGVNIAL